jgi:Mrp family chromosome partitioning ATPase/capsular polysaccharide biosynthesis protein
MARLGLCSSSRRLVFHCSLDRRMLQHQPLLIEDKLPLREHYEAVTTSAIRVVWQRKSLITLLTAMALVGSTLAVSNIDSKYTSESLIQLDFSRGEPVRAPQGAQQGPNLTIDASAVVETEARVIRSRAMAERVARHLDLEKNPAFSPTMSVAQRLLSWMQTLRGGAAGEAISASSSELIAAELLRNLAVTSDQHSFLISVSYTSGSPRMSAQIANAFAEEYIQNRREVIARQALAALALAYGPKHPSVVQAQSKVDPSDTNWRSGDNARIAMLAEPIAIPTGPNRLLIIGLATAGSLCLGILLALLLERRDNGFRSELEVIAATGLRCFGMMPVLGRFPECWEAARSIAAAAGLSDAAIESKVVLITSSVPGEGKSLIAPMLAESLVSAGKRVLFIDASPKASASASGGRHSITLEKALSDIDALLPLPGRGFAQLARASGLANGKTIFRSLAFDKLLIRARAFYDIIIIEAPPVLLLAEVYDLSRFADTVLHVIRWNMTPRSTVAAAMRRLQEFKMHPDGVVLAGVNLRKHRQYSIIDACLFYTRYRKYYRKHTDRQQVYVEEREPPRVIPQQEGVAR